MDMRDDPKLDELTRFITLRLMAMALKLQRDEVSHCLGALSVCQGIWSLSFPPSGEYVVYPPQPWGGEIGVGKARDHHGGVCS